MKTKFLSMLPRKYIAIGAAALGSSLPTASANITFEISAFTTDILSLTLSGDLTGPLPSTAGFDLYIYDGSGGVNTDWILDDAVDNNTFGETLGGRFLESAFASDDNVQGDSVVFQTLDADYPLGATFGGTGILNVTISEVGAFDPTAVSLSDLVLTWGLDDFDTPRFEGLTGSPQSFGPVPEPASAGLVAGIIAVAGCLLRRGGPRRCPDCVS